jgi:hypothetical protein
MAVGTQGDQIFFVVISEFASRSNVVDLQIDGAAALLATPAVSHQNFPMKLRVGCTL